MFLFFSLSGIAQELVTKKNAPKKALEAYTEARKLAYAEDFDKAFKEANKALKHAPNFFEAHYLLADLYVITGDKETAKTYFEKAIALGVDYQPRVLYSYGVWLYKEKEYEASLKALNQFISYPKIKENRKNRANEIIKTMNFRIAALAKPIQFEPQNMGPQINSAWDDLWPSISIDGSTFVFTRNVKLNEDFYISRKENEEWTTAKSIGAPINTPENEGAQSLSADGRFFAYTVCNRKGVIGRCDIYIAEKVGNQWTEPYNIGAPINTPGWESQPSLSADGNTLIFCRNVGKDQGGAQIMMSQVQEDGSWSKPVLLPETINTPGSEEAPFLHPDGETLYFISDGHPGMGESDIFFSRKTESGWTQAQNLGYPVNTEGQEFSIIVDFQGETAYYTSNQEGGYGRLDLYSFPLPEFAKPRKMTFVRARVMDAETKAPLQAQIELNQLGLDIPVTTKQQTNEQGEFLSCLPLGSNLAMHVKAEGYLFHSEHFALAEVNDLEEPYTLDIYLKAIPEDIIDVSTPVILENIFFETGSAVLLKNSRVELNQLKELLEKNPEMKIQINGHTDDVGDDAANQQLSEDRAKAVFDFLVEKNISANRLKFKGFGETSPIAPNDTKEGRSRNRRTEFLIQ